MDPGDKDLVALLLVARSEERALLVQHPKAGRTPLARLALDAMKIEDAAWEGEPLEGIEAVEELGESGGPPSMARLGEPLLLSCFRTDPAGEAGAKLRRNPMHAWATSDTPSDARLLEAWILYVPATNTLRRLTPWRNAYTCDPLGLSTDGSVLALEAYRRIVRLGPASDQRTVLFPR